MIVLTDSQMNILSEHKKVQDPKSEVVCSTSIGSYFNPSNIRRAMSSICKQAEIASTPKIIQERLGHADSRITLERYTHVSSELHVETAKRFQALLNENS